MQPTRKNQCSRNSRGLYWVKIAATSVHQPPGAIPLPGGTFVQPPDERSGYTSGVATTSAPKCPQCKSPLTLHESLARRRRESDPVKVIIPQRQWICSSETCMYTANHHVHAGRR